jgi:predicted amidohydrolase
VLAVNRVGTAVDLPHAGGSAVIDPLGVTLVEAGPVETVLTADVDAGTVARVRTDFPFLADRR